MERVEIAHNVFVSNESSAGIDPSQLITDFKTLVKTGKNPCFNASMHPFLKTEQEVKNKNCAISNWDKLIICAKKNETTNDNFSLSE